MIKNVAVAISGGVDSAVAAWIIKKQGYNAVGVFMKNWDEVDEKGQCSVSKDREDAKFVCHRVGIPFHEVNFVKSYWSNVFTYLIKEYENGYTPNPDIMCNRHIKFNAFLRYCTETLGIDALATGHYAQTSYGCLLDKADSSRSVKLIKAKDRFKDQTFFLNQVTQESLRKIMFPLGNLLKSNVKKLACDNDLGRIVSKKESTGICFIGKRNFQEFISQYVSPKPGPVILLTTGRVISEHRGLHLWTLGQCCRIQGYRDRLYVAAKNVADNSMIVVPGTNHPSLFTSLLFTSRPHWIADNPLDGIAPLHCQFRFQHTKPIVHCKVVATNGGLLVALERPLKSITPGQFAVFYLGDECLGGARINQAGPSLFSMQKTVPIDYREYEHFLENI